MNDIIGSASEIEDEWKQIVMVGDVLARKLSDIEDVFTIDDYLLLYNRASGTSIVSTDLKGTDPVVSRIARHQGVDRFDHGRPADVLLRHRDELLPKFSEEKSTKAFQKYPSLARSCSTGLLGR